MSEVCYFVGNVNPVVRDDELLNIFQNYGEVEKIHLKEGYAFVYMKPKKNAKIEALGGMILHNQPIRVEKAKGEGEVKMRERQKTRGSHLPNRTLFIANLKADISYDDLHTTLSSFGPLRRVEIVRNYAFAEFINVETAIRARKALNCGEINGSSDVVEFCSKNKQKPLNYGYGKKSKFYPCYIGQNFM